MYLYEIFPSLLGWRSSSRVRIAVVHHTIYQEQKGAAEVIFLGPSIHPPAATGQVTDAQHRTPILMVYEHAVHLAEAVLPVIASVFHVLRVVKMTLIQIYSRKL